MTTMSELMGCASATNKRKKNDFYETPDWAVERLLEAEKSSVPKWIWEPCVGRGAIKNVLIERGIGVVSSDLNPRKDAIKLDFLAAEKRLARAIVTNPPFRYAQRFIEKAYELEVDYLALLLKGDFLNSERRLKLVKRIGYPTRVYALTRRPDFLGQGAPTMNCSWYVWDGYGSKSSQLTCL